MLPSELEMFYDQKTRQNYAVLCVLDHIFKVQMISA